MTDRSRTRRLTTAATLVVAAVAVALGGCTAGQPDPTPAAGHSHGPGDRMVSLLVGDGTTAAEVGYELTDVVLPEQAGESGAVSFRIRYDGRPVTRFIEEQTRLLHLYVIRTDLAVFRHLHPTLGADGTWTAPVRLPEPGDYRVVAEFVAEDTGGNGDFLMLGATGTVPGEWAPVTPDPDAVASDGTVSVTATATPTVGPDGRLRLLVRDPEGRPVALGSYLGVAAHVTAVHLESGAIVHMHPMGAGETTSEGTELELHTEFTRPGVYCAFVQVRVDGFIHTLPVRLEVGTDAGA